MPTYRVQLEWPEVNDGCTYEDKLRGRGDSGVGRTVVELYTQRHGDIASEAE